MALNPAYIATKNPSDMNAICDAIRDYIVENIKSTKVKAMTCDLIRTAHDDGSPTTWDGPIVFRVEDNSQAVVDELAAMLAHFNPSEPNTDDPHHWRLMNDIHRELTTVEPSAQYTEWQPTKTVRFQLKLTDSEFPQLAESVNQQIVLTELRGEEHGNIYNVWEWHPDYLEEYDQKHIVAMLELWLQVKPVPEEV